MKFRLTPLNIVTAFALIMLFMRLSETKPTVNKLDISPLYEIVLGGLILVSMCTDFIFRFLFKDLKRIWLVELIFITLTVVLFLLLQK